MEVTRLLLALFVSLGFEASLLSQTGSQNHSLGCTSTWYEGEGTYYGGVAGSSGGHCGIYVDSGDVYHAAMNHVQYDSSNACGTCVRVLGPKGEVTLRIVDECPECKFGDIDMTTGVFPQLAEMKDGRINIKWQYVPCPLASDITLLFAPGSGPYYFKVQVGDANYPVTKMEYRKEDGTYESIHRAVYNYYVTEGGIDENKQAAGPYFFRFTASTGQVLYADSIVFSTTDLVHTGVQFSAVRCPDCAGVLDGAAKIDNCGACSGGSTGVSPNSTCQKDCAGYWDGTAYTDSCGNCVSGTTGATPCTVDCNNVPGGQAYVDHCGHCVGGTTGLDACAKDCNNEWGGSAYMDSCGNCAGGSTSEIPVLDTSRCPSVQTILLNEGWNLVSTNVYPVDSSISSVFENLEVNVVKNDSLFWSTRQPDALNLLRTIEAGKGYLVRMSNGGVLTVAGTPVKSHNFVFQSGWQLLGCPFQTETLFSDYFDATNCSTIKNFSGFWIPTGALNGISTFVPGEGYFLLKN